MLVIENRNRYIFGEDFFFKKFLCCLIWSYWFNENKIFEVFVWKFYGERIVFLDI